MNGNNKTWLHIGAGSFHRAHQAWYMHRLIESGDTEWGIALSNIRDDSVPMMKRLAEQRNRYTLETVDPSGYRAYETITSIKTVVPWDKELAALVAVGSEPETRVIAFTVTEGGYYLDTSHRLDQTNPDLRADLDGAKTTIYGAMRAILRSRAEKGGGPVTLLSCDNVRLNGKRFQGGLLEFLELRGDHDLSDWVVANASCPCCMVDRITPRPGPDVAKRVFNATGIQDEAPVMSEQFIQWVIENEFAAGRPEFEKVGVQMVCDVMPYEEAKIRILNSSHAAVAWAGTLVGLQYIHEGAATPFIRQIAHDYVTRDVIPCLTPCPLDLEAYRDTVISRFRNPYIQDTNQRVAADGFSKIPAMIAPTLIESYAQGREPMATAMLPALFFVYLRRWHEGMLPYAYQDGVMNEAQTHAMFDRPDPLAAYAADEALFGGLAGGERLKGLLRKAVAEAERLINAQTTSPANR